MNITQLRDPAQIYIKLATDLWTALEVALEGEDMTGLACLKPECNPSAEIAKRQWMALVTVSSIINLRVSIGEESLADVLADLDYCSC
jgi:hypothetical protein